MSLRARWTLLKDSYQFHTCPVVWIDSLRTALTTNTFEESKFLEIVTKEMTIKIR